MPLIAIAFPTIKTVKRKKLNVKSKDNDDQLRGHHTYSTLRREPKGDRLLNHLQRILLPFFRFSLNPYLALRFLARGHQLPYRVKDNFELGIVFLLHVTKLSGKVLVGGHQLAQLNERPHYLDIDLDSPLAIEHT